MTRSVLIAYYAATLLFLALDYRGGLNVRVAFLEPFPAWRAAYYGVCFLCLALVVWQPGWSVIVGAFESLVTLCALIISFGMRAILVTDAMLESGRGFVTMPEIVNFVISGGVAWLVWTRGMREIARTGTRSGL